MKKENQPKQRKRWKKVLLIILCIVLVLLLAGFLILRSIFMQPSIPAATGDDAQRRNQGRRSRPAGLTGYPVRRKTPSKRSVAKRHLGGAGELGRGYKARAP